MVYYGGLAEWHNTKWKVDSKFEKGKPGWAELRSEKVTPRLSVNKETGEAEGGTSLMVPERGTYGYPDEVLVRPSPVVAKKHCIS